ncbi:MAG: Gfo/Idh/MocA family oxidoreductase [Pseudomonadota bacterium]
MNSDKGNVRVSLVGAGVFGSYHAAKIAAIDAAQLLGVFDPDSARAADLASKHGVGAFNAFEDCLAGADAVIIAAPASAHFALCRDALSAGKHVFVEKPLALSAAEARSLAVLAAENSLVLQVGHQERYVCAAAGLFGRDRIPQRIECVRNVPYTGRCEDVSVVLDLMVHDIDIVRRLTGAAPVTVSAEGDETRLAAEVFLSSGTIATFNAARASASSDRRMTLVYEDGVIDFDFVRRSVSNSTSARIQSMFADAAAPKQIRDPLAYGAQLFIDGVIAGETHGVAGDDAAETVAWAEKIERAAGVRSQSRDRIGEVRFG